MKRIAAAALALLLAAGSAYSQGRRFRNFPNASPKPGEKAPEFVGVNSKGKKVKLSQFKGKKHVVLIFGAIT